MDPTVPPAAFVHGQLAAEPSPPGLLRSVGGRPHPICSPPVSALPSPITRGGLGEANRVQLAEKFLLSSSPEGVSEKLESFPELIHLLLQLAPGNQILGISFRYPDLLLLVGLEEGQPRPVIYKLSHQGALPEDMLLFCKYFSRSSSSDYTPMEAAAPSVPRIMAQLHAVHPTDLCSLVSRVVPKLLGQSPSLLNNNKMLLIVEPIVPELPVDILMHVFATLEIPDLVRAGSVCTSWFSAYATLRKLGKHKQHQTPCLLYTSESAGENVACLYSLVEKRVYKLNLPEPAIRTRYIIGSSLGFLVTVDERSELHLVNPITGQQIELPSVTTMNHVKPICNDSGAVHKYEYTRDSLKRAFSTSIYALCELRESFYYKARVFYDDTSTGSFIVALIHDPFGQLSFARVGDDKWTWLPPHGGYHDCTYKDGLLYAVTKRGEIHAFDLSGPAVTMEIIRGVDVDFDVDSVNIVQAPWGGLLLVSRLIGFEDPDDEEADDEEAVLPKYTVEIKLHKVDVGTMRLVEIDRLPEHVLFLGHNHALCLSAKEYPALKGNHAYFTDDDEYIAQRKSCRRDLGVIDLGSNSKEDLVSPQLWSNWPAPVWITLNPTMIKLPLNK